mmetsp:Transcript_6427/g.19448  ORF Transcript_6427/g.19448 Transcript_6427/m.19448 type:complete len:336 (+) Transcript_6427:480-1487(+)
MVILRTGTGLLESACRLRKLSSLVIFHEERCGTQVLQSCPQRMGFWSSPRRKIETRSSQMSAARMSSRATVSCTTRSASASKTIRMVTVLKSWEALTPTTISSGENMNLSLFAGKRPVSRVGSLSSGAIIPSGLPAGTSCRSPTSCAASWFCLYISCVQAKRVLRAGCFISLSNHSFCHALCSTLAMQMTSVSFFEAASTPRPRRLTASASACHQERFTLMLPVKLPLSAESFLPAMVTCTLKPDSWTCTSSSLVPSSSGYLSVSLPMVWLHSTPSTTPPGVSASNFRRQVTLIFMPSDSCSMNSDMGKFFATNLAAFLSFETMGSITPFVSLGV